MIATLVICDTSPPRALAHLGQMELLPRLFEQILVPPGVAEELAQTTALFPAMDLAQWPFVQVRAVHDLSAAQPYIQDLHAGESQAIALAIEVGARHILIDEAKGRKMAQMAGLTPVGVLGLFVTAKRRALIPHVRPLLDRLVTEVRFFVSDSVRRSVLEQAGETDTV